MPNQDQLIPVPKKKPGRKPKPVEAADRPPRVVLTMHLTPEIREPLEALRAFYGQVDYPAVVRIAIMALARRIFET
jgi:hypothetical protein